MYFIEHKRLVDNEGNILTTINDEVLLTTDHIDGYTPISDVLSSIYGKIKTWFLFISLGLGFISYKYTYFNKFILPLVIITTLLQIITLIDYAKKKDEISS